MLHFVSAHESSNQKGVVIRRHLQAAIMNSQSELDIVVSGRLKASWMDHFFSTKLQKRPLFMRHVQSNSNSYNLGSSLSLTNPNLNQPYLKRKMTLNEQFSFKLLRKMSERAVWAGLSYLLFDRGRRDSDGSRFSAA